MDRLSTNLITYLIEFLDAKSIVQFSSTSKSMNQSITNECYWNYRLSSYCLPDLEKTSSTLGNIAPKVQSFGPYLQYSQRVDDPFNVYTSAFRSLNCMRPMIAEGVDESSRDYDQDIRRVLSLDDAEFWSSTGSPSTDANEYLQFKLKSPCIIFAVQLKVYLCRYQGGRLYPPQKISFTIGPSKDSETFTSEEFVVQRHENPQQFFILPQIVVGEYIKLNLIGKVLTQEEDDLYYTVLNHVEVFGAPLTAVACPTLAAGLQLRDIDDDKVVSHLERKEFKAARKLMLNDRNMATIYNLTLLQEGDPEQLRKYLQKARTTRRLNGYETYMYVKTIEPTPKISVHRWEFTHSEATGDLYYDLQMYNEALAIYHGSQNIRKGVKCFLALEEYSRVEYIQKNFSVIDAETVLQIADEVAADCREKYLKYLEEVGK